jgi:hypothetical protein
MLKSKGLINHVMIMCIVFNKRLFNQVVLKSKGLINHGMLMFNQVVLKSKGLINPYFPFPATSILMSNMTSLYLFVLITHPS